MLHRPEMSRENACHMQHHNWDIVQPRSHETTHTRAGTVRSVVLPCQMLFLSVQAGEAALAHRQ